MRNNMKKLLKFKENFQLSVPIKSESTLNSQLFSEPGQTLLEALIALAAAVVIISVMSVLVLSSLNNAQFSKNQNQATQYAQQGIEVIKNISQSNWTAFASYTLINYCMPSDNSLSQRVGGSCGQNMGIYSREVTINQDSSSCNPSSNNALITASVSWSDSKCTSPTDPYCHKIKIVSCIYNSATILAP